MSAWINRPLFSSVQLSSNWTISALNLIFCYILLHFSWILPKVNDSKKGAFGDAFCKRYGGQGRETGSQSTVCLLGNSPASLRLFTLAAAPTLFLSLFSSRTADQTRAAVDFWGAALPLPLIWSASTSWWRLFTHMLTCPVFLGQGSVYSLAPERQQNAAFCLVTLQGLFHQGLNLRCTTFCISFFAHLHLKRSILLSSHPYLWSIRLHGDSFQCNFPMLLVAVFQIRAIIINRQIVYEISDRPCINWGK